MMLRNCPKAYPPSFLPPPFYLPLHLPQKSQLPENIIHPPSFFRAREFDCWFAVRAPARKSFDRPTEIKKGKIKKLKSNEKNKSGPRPGNRSTDRPEIKKRSKRKSEHATPERFIFLHFCCFWIPNIPKFPRDQIRPAWAVVGRKMKFSQRAAARNSFDRPTEIKKR